MSPETKNKLSALAVAVAVALLGILSGYIPHLPAEARVGAAAIIAAVVHFVNTWGTAESTEKKVEARVAEAIESERTP